MVFKYGILGGLALLADQTTALSWELDNKALVTEAKESAANPSITTLDPQFFKDLSAQRVSVKYGPHSVPGTGNMTSASAMPGMAMKGMTFLDRNATKPCEDCMITWMQANLVYEDGKVANADSGMWLHHAVALNRGRKDAVCGKSAVPLQRFFASGNERTAVNLAENGTSKTGYYLGKKDRLMMLMELMNSSPEARNATMTIDYEFIPASKAKEAKFERVDTMWLDVGGCTASEQTVKSNGTSEYAMEAPFEARRNGKVLGLGSHVHDGGINMEIKQNDKMLCDSVAKYGETPAYVSTMPGMPAMPNMPAAAEKKMEHVSSISSCYNMGEYKKGDKFSVKAFYDMEKHAGMMEPDGKLAPVMGISLVYTVPERKMRDNGTMPAGGEMPGMRGDGVRVAAGLMSSVGVVAAVAAIVGFMI